MTVRGFNTDFTTRDAAEEFLRKCGLDPNREAIDALVDDLPTLRNICDAITEDDYESVDHPDHYGGDTPYEVIKVLEAWSDMFHLPVNITSAIKYLSRAGRKPGVPIEQDLNKALWHIQREITRLEQ